MGGRGITEGRWISFESQTNQEKVIQDSFFHQDYSYQITTGVGPEEFEAEYRDIMHPVGLKLFTLFSKVDIINIDIEVPEEAVELLPNFDRNFGTIEEAVTDEEDFGLVIDEVVLEIDWGLVGANVFQAENNFIYISSLA